VNGTAKGTGSPGGPSTPGGDPSGYPIAQRIPQEVLDAEAGRLAALATAPAHKRIGGYARLAGPGFMGAALTLGAGTLTSSMLSGATFGYRTLWLIWLACGLGLFMMAAMARFTCKGGFRVIQVQNRRHSWLIGSLLTALVPAALLILAVLAVLGTGGDGFFGLGFGPNIGPQAQIGDEWFWQVFPRTTTVILTIARSCWPPATRASCGGPYSRPAPRSTSKRPEPWAPPMCASWSPTSCPTSWPRSSSSPRSTSERPC